MKNVLALQKLRVHHSSASIHAVSLFSIEC